MKNGLGLVYHPRSIVQVGGDRTEPDLMVRREFLHKGWASAPLPILVVEVLSLGTGANDLGKKRRFYMNAGIAEYWIVDREEGVVTHVPPGREARISTILTWAPPGSPATLDVDVERIFADIPEPSRGPQGAAPAVRSARSLGVRRFRLPSV